MGLFSGIAISDLSVALFGPSFSSKAATFVNLVPVFAVLAGWTVLDEGLSFYQCISAAVVVGGVWLSQK